MTNRANQNWPDGECTELSTKGYSNCDRRVGNGFCNQTKGHAGDCAITPLMRKLKFRQHTLAEDPVGLHVMVCGLGRDLIGEVVGVEYSNERGTVLNVRHFNGEMWPYQPRAACVEVLVRH